MAGLSLTGAFAGAQLGAPAPAARVSHTGFSVVAVRAFRRSQLFPSRDRQSIASARARRARAGTPSDPRERALGDARAFEDGVHRRVARASRWRARTRAAPHAACIARARLRSGLGSGFTARARRGRYKYGPPTRRARETRETLPAAPRFSRRRAPLRRSRLSARPLTTRASLAPRRAPIRRRKKKWEKQALNQNGNPVRHPICVKTNDKVVVITGADKGKVTEVVEVFTRAGPFCARM